MRPKQARSEMSQAAIELTTSEPPNAEPHQQNALEKLDVIYRAVAPFEHLLQRSIEMEEQLVEKTQPISESKNSTQFANSAHRDSDLLQTQKQVASWIAMLEPKAAAQLNGIESQPAAAPTVDASEPGNQPKEDKSQDNTAQQKAYYQKGIELGPKAHEAAIKATDMLSKKDWTPALEQDRKWCGYSRK